LEKLEKGGVGTEGKRGQVENVEEVMVGGDLSLRLCAVFLIIGFLSLY